MEKARYLIFDAGPLINFAMNGILDILENLKKVFEGEFLITKEVKYEIIDHPLLIKRFELEALKLKDLFDRKIIKLASITPGQVNELRKIRNHLMDIANSTFIAKGRYLHLLDKGECAVFALASLLSTPYVVIDERTARLLCENPENLRKILEKKLHSYVEAKKKNYKYFKDFKIIRSAELVYYAYKKNLVKLKDPKLLEALLYGVKYKGCSISREEIEEMKRINRIEKV